MSASVSLHAFKKRLSEKFRKRKCSFCVCHCPTHARKCCREENRLYFFIHCDVTFTLINLCEANWQAFLHPKIYCYLWKKNFLVAKVVSERHIFHSFHQKAAEWIEKKELSFFWNRGRKVCLEATEEEEKGMGMKMGSNHEDKKVSFQFLSLFFLWTFPSRSRWGTGYSTNEITVQFQDILLIFCILKCHVK